jgi:hypothetical protein
MFTQELFFRKVACTVYDVTWFVEWMDLGIIYHASENRQLENLLKLEFCRGSLRGDNLCQYHFVRHKSHIKYPGFEYGPLWEAKY